MLRYLFFTGAALAISPFAAAQNNPPSGGVSYEDALAEANALLLEHGIDPTGEGMDHHDDHQHDESHASAETFIPLTLEEIQANPDVWPAKVVMLERVEFTSGLLLTPGNQVDFSGFAPTGEAYLEYENQGLSLPANYTDVVERANDVARGQAKADGFRGRLLEQLDGRIVVPQGSNMVRASSNEIEGGDLYLLYMSSEACGWCRQFTPDLVRAVERAKQQYPGQLKLIHASVDRNMSEFQTKYAKLEADAAIPPGDRWFINTYSNLHSGVRQIAQPSLMLMNVNGRLLDSGMRNNRDTSAIKDLLERLPGNLARSASLRPAWVALESPLSEAKPLMATSAPIITLDVGPIVENTDPTIAGPLPYPATLRDGTEVPGLVIYDSTATGGRIPALTVQAYPATAENDAYYVLAFREVLGQTFGSKPLLKAWMESTTRQGPGADEDLKMLVESYKELHNKFDRWRQTAIENNVSDFQKEIMVFPMTRVINRVTLSNSDDTDLEVMFGVGEDPSKATLRFPPFTMVRPEREAFERLFPQIDALISQLPQEITRMAEARQEKVQDLQDVDSLFN